MLLLKDNWKNKLIKQVELVLGHKMPVSDFHSQNHCSYDVLRVKTKLISKLYYLDLKVNICKLKIQQLSLLLMTLKLICKNNFKTVRNKLNSLLDLARGNTLWHHINSVFSY